MTGYRVRDGDWSLVVGSWFRPFPTNDQRPMTNDQRGEDHADRHEDG